MHRKYAEYRSDRGMPYAMLSSIADNDPLIKEVIRTSRMAAMPEADRQVCEQELERYVVMTYQNVKPEWCEVIFDTAELAILQEDMQHVEA